MKIFSFCFWTASRAADSQAFAIDLHKYFRLHISICLAGMHTTYSIYLYISMFFSDASENVKNLSVNPMGHEGIVTKLSEPVTCKSSYRCIYILHVNIYRYVYHILCVTLLAFVAHSFLSDITPYRHTTPRTTYRKI